MKPHKRFIRSRGAFVAVSVSTLLVSGGLFANNEGGGRSLPTLASTVSDCASVSNPCVQVDLAQASHTISPLLFGDGIEWKERGQNVLAPDPSGRSSGIVRSDVMAALKRLKFPMMRYPGGTLADLFHWDQAVGPIAGRRLQYALDLDGNGNLLQEVPYFGPDEFASFARQLRTEILLTVNVATGSPEEAAGWVSYWKTRKVPLKYVEIGNETYLAGPGGSFPAMAATEYARKFDAFAAAIRAVDPAVKLGAIGTMDTSSWCYPICKKQPWNEIVLQSIRQKADFFAVHNAYAPGIDQESQAIYEAMLSYPNFIRFGSWLIAEDIDFFASAQNKGMPLATTEHSSYFLPPPGADLPTLLSAVGRNHTWAAALYSALVFQGFIQNPRFLIANHINPLHYAFQAPITVAPPDLSTYPFGYSPDPVLSSYGLVYKAYRELASQRHVPAAMFRSPTIHTAAVGNIPELRNTPLLDAVAARASDTTAKRQGWLFLINRSLTTELNVSFVLKNRPAQASILEVALLSASDHRAKNLPGGAAHVRWVSLKRRSLTDPGSFGTTVSVPKHSLVRVRLTR